MPQSAAGRFANFKRRKNSPLAGADAHRYIGAHARTTGAGGRPEARLVGVRAKHVPEFAYPVAKPILRSAFRDPEPARYLTIGVALEVSQ